MAINDERESRVEQLRARPRVVVKLAEAAIQVRSGEHWDDAKRRALAGLSRILPGNKVSSYFEEERGLRAVDQTPFNRYVAVETTDRESAAEIARTLQSHGLVEEAYVEGGPVPPPVNAVDDPRSVNQGYLDAAPQGIDARWVWSMADGSGIGFVDLERGWTLNHEDLAAANITIISGVNQDYFGHGTSVLGEVVAVDNTRGDVGIAPRASCRVVSQWRTATTYSTAAAILSAGQAMSKGDVLLLEAQTSVGSQIYLPVEVETAVFDAIRHVTNDGIVVVEAAGNGGHDLDAFVNAANRHVLNRNSNDFRDSGAIMVGAASSTAPHTRLSFSCHGSRIDCYGWGENIDTTGDGGLGNLTNTYTGGFGGTSGASPMVAGAAVLLQSWRKKYQTKVYSPDDVRDLLSSSANNTPSANPATDGIGVMPNLRAVIEAVLDQDKWGRIRENYVSFVYILFGLIDDSPGVVWVPGKGPGPVDPGWLPTSKISAGPKRDLIAAFAVNEITQTIEDQATRTKLQGAAVDAMRGAIERIAGLR